MNFEQIEDFAFLALTLEGKSIEQALREAEKIALAEMRLRREWQRQEDAKPPAQAL